jgi:maltose-binding protein MalE
MRRINLLPPVIALAAVVAACGGGGGDSGASAAPAGSAGSLKGQTITYWASNQATTLEDDKRILTEEAAKFTRQTGVKVNIRVIGWPDLFTNITTATTSGKVPDVLNIGNTWAASLQATGAFMDFDTKALGSIGGKDKFVATSFSATGAKDTTPTSVPLCGLSYGLFYNTKLFKAAGHRGAAQDVGGVRRRRQAAHQAARPVRRHHRGRQHQRGRALRSSRRTTRRTTSSRRAWPRVTTRSRRCRSSRARPRRS